MTPAGEYVPRREAIAWETLRLVFEVHYSGDELVLTCRRCGKVLCFSQSYHTSAVLVSAEAHLDGCRAADAADP